MTLALMNHHNGAHNREDDKLGIPLVKLINK
jgi:hypothetical protein